MKRVGLIFFMALLLAGCKSRRDPAEQPSTAAEPPAPPSELPVAVDDAPVVADESNAAPPIDEQAAPAGEASDTPAPAEGPAAAEGERASVAARDLAAELRAAVGSPLDCIQDYRPSNTTVIRVNISAIVRPSGLIIEPSASGTGLSANDRGCIQRRVGDVVLAPFDALQSQSVSTSLELNYEAPAPKEANVGVPTPELKDVVEALPKKPTIPRSGTPIDTAPFDRPDGPKGLPPDGPKGDKITGPKPKPIDGYEVEEDSEIWTDD